ncbi:AAA family ATPase [Acinetobacter sp. 1207_04]|uniref:AAA family ATPase n=1 Tax=Acinetobacter sp. 1207_04 TaxID=2604449 RepID=UPI0040584252
MKIHAIRLRHACHFSDLKVEFNPNQSVTLIIGEQASGKTTLLKNMFHALSWFPARFKDLRSPGIVMPDQDIMYKRVQSKIEIEVDVPTEIGPLSESADARSINTFRCQWELYKTLNATGVGISKVEVEQLEQLTAKYIKAIKQDPMQGLPLVAFYPTERFVNEISLLNKNNPHVFQSATAYEAVPLPFTTFTRFFEWLREISDVENAQTTQVFQQILADRKQSKLTSTPPDTSLLADALLHASTQMHTPALTALRTTLQTVIPDITDLFIEYQPRLQLMVVYKGQTIQFVQLSNSFKNLVAMLGDIVRRMCLLNPLSLYPCIEGDGILMIDELDAQLDDSYSLGVLERLHHAFPRVQIIVTSQRNALLETAEQYQCFLLQDKTISQIQFDNQQQNFQQIYADLLSNHSTSDQNIETESTLENIEINTSEHNVTDFFQKIQSMNPEEKLALLTLLRADHDPTPHQPLN